MSENNYQGPGLYRHYKGADYGVLGLALQEDTVVKEGEPRQRCERCGGALEQAHCPAAGRRPCRMEPLTGREVTFVIYQPLTPGSMLENRDETFWARRLDDFNDHVTVNGEIVPRFRKIGEAPTRLARTDKSRAPAFVRERGGVLLSLWFYGADERDLDIVRDLLEKRDRSAVHG